MITVQRQVRLGQNGRPKKASGKPPVARVPRVARLMALAIRFDQLIRDGVVADQAELARLGHVTRARVTQIMNLLALAPDIQEALLFLPPVEQGRDRLKLAYFQKVALEVDWGRQREIAKLGAIPKNEGGEMGRSSLE